MSPATATINQLMPTITDTGSSGWRKITREDDLQETMREQETVRKLDQYRTTDALIEAAHARVTHEELEREENLQDIYDLHFPHITAVLDEIKYRAKKESLIKLAKRFASEVIAISEDDGEIIDQITVDMAVRFLSLLSNQYQLPRIASDEGGILLVWRTPEKSTVITFVEHELYVADAAGSPFSRHIGP